MTRLSQNVTFNNALSIGAGIILATISQAFFLVPNHIVPSGLVGLGTVLYHSLGIPIGLFVILCNVVLIAIQSRIVGIGAGGKTVVTIILQGALLDVLTSWMHVTRLAEDPMLACIYGGVLTGLGGALIFKGGATLGGTDILAQLLLRFRGIQVGTTFLWSDAAVLAVAALVYGPNLALFALIKSFIVSQTIDRVMEGSGDYRQVLIMSKQAETICWGVIEELHRGVTYLEGRGAYSNKPMDVLLTAVRRSELPHLEELVYQIDPVAFLIVTDARRVIGKGFESLEEELAGMKEVTGTPLPKEPAPASH
ncbi:MAG TPA: YitT family protein [Candidatus Ozemobacteraceae bacterium]|nr:YitT family protein [Candidatus Ozemobacteraceae bacterium]